MNASLLLGIVLVGALVWGWRDAMRAREKAVELGRAACDAHGVQLLDDTVELVSIGLRRDRQRRWYLRRVYQFEYSADGVRRRAGSIALRAAAVEGVWLPEVDPPLQ